jgi:lipid-A-disaccharide synthase
MSKHIVLVAGEASGDLHAAKLVLDLQNQTPDDYQFSAIGGQHLADAGAFIIHDLAQYGVTGATEVIRHARQIHTAFKKIKAYLRQHPADLLILVDYPGFNLRLAKFAKSELKIRVLYYISPQIWAWKAKRIETIRRYVDHMAVILPFEKAIYDQASIPCTFVGHPLLNNLPQCTQEAARTQLMLPQNKRIVALLPGSRQHEVQKLFPLLIQSAQALMQQFSDLHFVVPVASTLSQTFLSSFLPKVNLPLTFITGQTPLSIQASDVVAVASGTAALECALLLRPMCIIYKSALLSYLIGIRLIRVKYFGLCNLIAKKMIVPELLQADCKAAHITEVVSTYLLSSAARNQAIAELAKVKQTLMQSEVQNELSDLVRSELESL